MNEKQVQDIVTHLRSKATEELQAIWKKNDRREYSDEGFEAVKRLLTERRAEMPAQDQPVLPKSASTNEPIKCPGCGSQRVKKRFFGGSKGGAIACFVLGFFLAYDELRRPHGDPTVLVLTLVFVLAGIAALTGKRFKCLECKKGFNDTKK